MDIKELKDIKHFKNVLPLKVLEVLKEESDIEHPLTRERIAELLDEKAVGQDFELEKSIDKKMIKRSLYKLYEAEYIGYTKGFNRTNAQGKSEEVRTGWYYEHEFADAELRLLIDSLLFYKNIPYDECRKLIEKLQGLTSSHFKTKVNSIRNLPLKMPNNPDVFLCIELLDEAIAKGMQVEFTYNNFDVKGKLTPRTFDDGSVRKYIVNPYQMVASNSKYYLICNFEKYSNVGDSGQGKHSNLSHYRVDRITDVKILDTPAKKKKDLDEEINLPTHMAEHIYMFSGKSGRVRMRIDTHLVSDVIDWFGKGVTFRDETKDTKIATVTVNLMAMRYWAMQYANHVEILSPASLREEIKKDLFAAVEKYKDE